MHLHRVGPPSASYTAPLTRQAPFHPSVLQASFNLFCTFYNSARMLARQDTFPVSPAPPETLWATVLFTSIAPSTCAVLRTGHVVTSCAALSSCTSSSWRAGTLLNPSDTEVDLTWSHNLKFCFLMSQSGKTEVPSILEDPAHKGDAPVAPERS